MSFFSNHSHSQSITTTDSTGAAQSYASASASSNSTASRQRTSSSNATNNPHLRSSSSKLSLSISSPPEIRERTLTSGSQSTNNANAGATLQNNQQHTVVNGNGNGNGGGGLYSSATPTSTVVAGSLTPGVLTKGGPTPLRHTWVFWFRQQPKAMGVRRPVWEDPLNQNGGKWIIRLRKSIADRLWEDLVLAVIGDQFDIDDGICGVVLSVRGAEDILSVWNRDDKDADAKGRIRDVIRRALGLPKETIMEYKSNNDSMNDRSSFRTTSSSNLATIGSLGLQGGQNVLSTPS
ncbi:hypothetical protein FRB97_004151 [Tulasnella sp. 331]|nr:hypothetical protein FRB97_004151 [Tulasnella sp. 331]